MASFMVMSESICQLKQGQLLLFSGRWRSITVFMNYKQHLPWLAFALVSFPALAQCTVRIAASKAGSRPALRIRVGAGLLTVPLVRVARQFCLEAKCGSRPALPKCGRRDEGSPGIATESGGKRRWMSFSSRN